MTDALTPVLVKDIANLMTTVLKVSHERLRPDFSSFDKEGHGSYTRYGQLPDKTPVCVQVIIPRDKPIRARLFTTKGNIVRFDIPLTDTSVENVTKLIEEATSNFR